MKKKMSWAEASARARADRKGDVVATFSLGLSSIKLHGDGRVESKHGSGSVIGATARIDETPNLPLGLTDSYLAIEGPGISLSVKLASTGLLGNRKARKFVAEVNRLSAQSSPAATKSETLEFPEYLGMDD